MKKKCGQDYILKAPFMSSYAYAANCIGSKALISFLFIHIYIGNIEGYLHHSLIIDLNLLKYHIRVNSIVMMFLFIELYQFFVEDTI